MDKIASRSHAPSHTIVARDRVKSRIADLRRQSNALAPIACLPMEMLSSVFKECVCEDEDDTMGGLWRREVVTLSHVTHHWRTVALATRTLWNAVVIVPSTQTEQLEEWLKRSGQTQLSVTARGSFLDSTSLSRVLEEISRIQTLNLDVDPQSLALSSWPQHNSPLKHLRLHDKFRRQPDENEDEDYLRSFGEVVQKRFPALEQLVAISYNFDFKYWHLPSTLTHLEVSNRGVSPEGFLQDVIETLRHLPLLCTLSLRSFLSPETLPIATEGEPVSLPSLQVLSLYGSEECALLLGRLHFPPTVRLILELAVERDYDRLSVTSPICSHLRRIPQLKSAYLCAQSKDNHDRDTHATLKLKGWRDERSMGFIKVHVMYSRKADIDIEITIPFTGHDDDEDLLPMKDLFAASPLSSINSLYLNCLQGDSVPEAPELYCKMDQLHTLALIGPGKHSDSVAKLVNILEQHHDEVFPVLRALYVAAVEDLSGVFQPFGNFLKIRQEHARDNTLFLEDCASISRIDIDALAEDISIHCDKCGDFPIPESDAGESVTFDFDDEGSVGTADLDVEDLE